MWDNQARRSTPFASGSRFAVWLAPGSARFGVMARRYDQRIHHMQWTPASRLWRPAQNTVPES
jgi:hypothetical protein